MLMRLLHRITGPMMLTFGLMITLGLALLLGSWLARVQAPLSRHSVAHNLLESGRADQAAYVFDTPIWQGVALYRAGRYHRAVGAFVADDSVIGLYNMGNAYAQLGLYRGAISAYEAVLNRQPDHKDARFNLELVRRAADRERELLDESRRTENEGGWEDGLRDNREHGEPETTSRDQTGENEATASSEPPRSGNSEQDPDQGLGETSAPESEITSAAGGDSHHEGDASDALVFSLSEQKDGDADKPSTDRALSEEAIVLDGTVNRAGEEALADEITLRRINDDPAIVLRARLNMALRKQQAGR